MNERAEATFNPAHSEQVYQMHKEGWTEETHYLTDDYGMAVTTVINLKDLKIVIRDSRLV